MFFTYTHRRNDTGQVFYVGKGREDRAAWVYGRTQHWKRVAEKHGYTIDIIGEWPVEADAFSHEIKMIQHYRDLGHPLVNKTGGGEGLHGWTHSEASKLQMRASATGRKASDATKKKHVANLARRWAAVRAAEALNPRPQVEVIILTDEELAAKKTIRYERSSVSLKAHYAVPENLAQLTATRRASVARDKDGFANRVSTAMLKSHERPEVIAKISQKSLAAWANPESRARHCKAVRCIETGVTFGSGKEAGIAMGIQQGSVSASCRGTIKSAAGYHFEFTNPQPTPS